MPKTRSQKLDTDQLRSRLKLRAFASERKLLEAHAAAREFFERVKLRPGKIREHAWKLLSSGALAGTLLLTSPAVPPLPPSSSLPARETGLPAGDWETELAASLREVLPPDVRPLTIPQEEEISRRIKKILGINATAILENNHLNQTYGYIGAEQHLARFPGDNVPNMAPGLGGWGYVPEEIERYYLAVQTLYLPDWATNTRYLSNWYKFRRCLVINPINGKAVIAAIADAGPAWWTGKHFGGSPEVMAHLKLNVGKQKGPVIVFFLDDPQELLPLGPVEYNKASHDENLL
jgi:hypothetical protein